LNEESEVAVAQIQQVLSDYRSSIRTYAYGETGIPDEEAPTLLARAEATIERLAPVGSSYRKSMERSISQWGGARHEILKDAVGVLEALHSDFVDGYLVTLPALIHGQVFSDFLEMASHLLESHYKDAAAVIAGSTLESHLRELAKQAGVKTEDENGRLVKADGLNGSLTKEGAYDKTEQKQVTAWLGIRNDAAHGNYAAYDQPRVALMIDGIREFMRRNPA
jgi:hypothetical protein